MAPSPADLASTRVSPRGPRTPGPAHRRPRHGTRDGRGRRTRPGVPPLEMRFSHGVRSDRDGYGSRTASRRRLTLPSLRLLPICSSTPGTSERSSHRKVTEFSQRPFVAAGYRANRRSSKAPRVYRERTRRCSVVSGFSTAPFGYLSVERHAN